MNSIALIPNTHKNLWEESTKKLAKKILSSGKNVLIDKELKKNMKEIQGITFMEFDSLINNSSMLISLGGDGTLINLAKIAAPKDIPILGINTGNLGYLVELEINEFDWLDKIFSGNFSYDTRTMLDICVIRENIAVADFLA